MCGDKLKTPHSKMIFDTSASPTVAKESPQCQSYSKNIQKVPHDLKIEKTGHLPLSIVKQEGLNPDYGRGKTCVRLSVCMSVCVCVVYVSVACCQCVLGSIDKQQVS